MYKITKDNFPTCTNTIYKFYYQSLLNEKSDHHVICRLLHESNEYSDTYKVEVIDAKCQNNSVFKEAFFKDNKLIKYMTLVLTNFEKYEIIGTRETHPEYFL